MSLGVGFGGEGEGKGGKGGWFVLVGSFVWVVGLGFGLLSGVGGCGREWDNLGVVGNGIIWVEGSVSGWLDWSGRGAVD